MTSVLVKDLTLKFGAVTVLDNLNIDIPEGEFLVLLGASGCGKSTLLNCIAGLLDVTDGEIHINDRNVTWEEPSGRGIGMVFQSYALYPQMTVEGNLSFGLKNARMPKDEIQKRVARAAEILQIEPLLQRKPAALSGGQRQRVAIGRALVRDVDVFLFDEPLSNLDAKLRVQMRLEIRKLQQRLGVTSIYVTHDQVEAMTLGDRLMVLNGGYVEQFGTPIELYDRPASVFVAGFIGSPAMNFIPAKAENGTLSLPGGAQVSSSSTDTSGDVLVGLRPEHLVPDENGPVSIDVEMVEQLGANTLLHGTLSGTSHEMVASVAGHVTADSGAQHRFAIAPELVHLFDPKTEKRLDA